MVAMSGAQPRIQWDLLFNFSPSPTPLFHGGQLPFATARFQPGQQSPTATTSRIRPILSLCVTLQGAKHRCFPFPSILVIQTQLSIPQTLSHHPEKQPLSYLTGWRWRRVLEGEDGHQPFLLQQLESIRWCPRGRSNSLAWPKARLGWK